LLIYIFIKGLIQALGIAETQRSWYMSKSSCLLKIYGIKIIHQRDIKVKRLNILYVFQWALFSSVYTTFINFIYSFRFDTSFNFLLYIQYILNNTSEIFALCNRIPLFLNGQLVSSLSYPGLLVSCL
jgi:hypothetical protein